MAVVKFQNQNPNKRTFFPEIMRAKDNSIIQATLIKVAISLEDYRFDNNHYML